MQTNRQQNENTNQLKSVQVEQDWQYIALCVNVYRTGAVEEARRLVEMFGWTQYFSLQEIYPGDKTTHFKRSFVIFWSLAFNVSVPIVLWCLSFWYFDTIGSATGCPVQAPGAVFVRMYQIHFLANERWRSSAGKIATGLAESNGSCRWVYD